MHVRSTSIMTSARELLQSQGSVAVQERLFYFYSMCASICTHVYRRHPRVVGASCRPYTALVATIMGLCKEYLHNPGSCPTPYPADGCGASGIFSSCAVTLQGSTSGRRCSPCC